MTSRLGTFALLRRHLASGIGASLLVAVLVFLAILAVAAAPRALAQIATAELRHELSSRSPLLRDLSGIGRIGLVLGLPDPTLDRLVGTTDEAIRALPSKLPEPLGDGAGKAEWIVRTTAAGGGLPDLPTHDLVVELAIDLDWRDRVEFLDGDPPAPWEGSEDLPFGTVQPPIEVALAAPIAELMNVGIGDVISYGPAADLLVAGLYEPIESDDGYWVHARDLAIPTLEQEPGSRPKIRASMFVDPDTLIGMQDGFANGELQAWIPIDPEAYDFTEIDVLRVQLNEEAATQEALPNYGILNLRSGTQDVMELVAGRVAATSAMLALCYSGLFGVLLAAFAVGIQILIRRRRMALALVAARGAGEVQLRGVMMIEALILTAPGAVLAMVICELVFATPVGPEGWILPVLVAAAPPVLAVVLTTARARQEPRGDLRLRSRSRSRWVVETAVIALAVTALFLLWRRGLVASSAAVGVDPLLAATPLLLAAAVCVLALRAYPLPMRAVQAITRRRGTPTGLVGAARAVRDPALGFATAFALVVGVAVIVFASVTATTIHYGLVAGARDDVGADVQIRAHDLPAELVDELGALDGVESAVSFTVTSRVAFSDGTPGNEITVVTADTAALHAVRPDIPVLEPREDGRVALLVSSDWVDRINGDDLIVGEEPAASEGVILNTALPGQSRRWVLVDERDSGDIGVAATTPRAILLDLSPLAPGQIVDVIDQTVTDAQPSAFRGGVRVTDARGRLAEVLTSPTVSGLHTALVIAAGAAVLLTLLIVALTSIAATGVRNRVVGVLRILGMSRRQIRALLAWELGPVTILSLVVGTGLGLALPLLLTTVVDLRTFVGGSIQPGPAIDPLWLAAAVGAFIVAVMLAGLVAAALSRRFAPAGTLKMGDT